MLQMARNTIVFLFCFLMIVGCASTPIRTDYSKNVSSLKAGIYLDNVWFDNNELSSNRYSEVRLTDVKGLGITDQTNITVAQAIEWLRESTIKPRKDNVVLKSSETGKTLNLELVITELNPGDTVTRFWIGELGAGHAWIQVEGKLTDAESKKLIGYFVERDRKSGVATFRNSRGYDSGPGLIQDMIDDIGNKIRNEFETILKIKIN